MTPGEADTNGHANLLVLRDVLHRQVERLAIAWRLYADELLLGLDGPPATISLLDEPTELLQLEAEVHEAFAALRGEVVKAHPELVELSAVTRLPQRALRALTAAGITTVAELQQVAGTLQWVQGIGPAMVREIEESLVWARDNGLLA